MMNLFYSNFKSAMFTALLLFVTTITYSQKQKNSYYIGQFDQLMDEFKTVNRDKKKDEDKDVHEFRISESETITVDVNVRVNNQIGERIIGTIENHPNSIFSFSRTWEGEISGKIIMLDTKTAYEIYGDAEGKTYIKEQKIGNMICLDMKNADTEAEKRERLERINNTKKPQAYIDTLESVPGGLGTIYLDFDGEQVPAGSWGAAITAAPSGFSEALQIASWRTMSEDFRPFKINVTTNRAVFDATPITRRVQVIFTPTSTAAPDAGGVAFGNSFSDSWDEPCWVFNSGTNSGPETGSHEAGHTFGLGHDGYSTGQYYGGHGLWGPIMGGSYGRQVTHWSIGEYKFATSSQDDIAIIASPFNNVGFVDDLQGNDPSTAVPLNYLDSGTVVSDSVNGIIHNRDDKDVYQFITKGGDINFSAQPDSFDPNLDIQLRLLDFHGNEILKNDVQGVLNSAMNTTVSAGVYFLEVDGVGYLDPYETGYSDYSSIGYYQISGFFPATTDPLPPIARFNADSTFLCTGGSANFTNTSFGSPDTLIWTFEGGTPNTSTDLAPRVTYDTPGIYDVTLEIRNGEGTSIYTDTSYIAVGQSLGIPFQEGFEGDFPPANWYTVNPDAQLAFEKSTKTGNESSSCMIMNNADNSVTGEIDEIVMMPLDFTGATKATMLFDVGYTMYNASSPDQLRIFVATKCNPAAGDWTEVWFKTHTQLETVVVSQGQSNDWVPSKPSDWRTEVIDLSAYNDETFVLLKFHNTSGFGTRIWIDNINILTGTELPIANFTVNDTTLCVGQQIDFTDLSKNLADTWAWTFEGGTPATSTDQNPSVTYDAIGTYQVKLVASNSNGSDSLIKSGHINVTSIITTAPFSEDFEGTFPPTGWEINNPDDGLTWEQRTDVGHDTSTRCMIMNNSDNAEVGAIDEIIIGTYDISGLSKPAMSFYIAYTRYKDDSPDRLRVYGSTNCGDSWGSPLYDKNHVGMETAVVATGQSNSWKPTTEAHWRQEIVSLETNNGQTEVMLKFHNTSGFGTRIWIDDINIYEAVGINELSKEDINVQVYPNPSNGTFNVSLLSLEKDNYTIEVTNVIGQIVYNEVFSGQGDLQKQFDLSDSDNGMYLITIKSSKGISIKKLIKQ